MNILKLASYLAKKGHYKLGKKLLLAESDGITAKLTKDEKGIMGIIRSEFPTTELGVQFPTSGTTGFRREVGYNPGGFNKQGGVGKAYYSEFDEVPMIDIDVPDGLHPDGAIIFKDKQTGLNNLREHMKTPFGNESAYRLYDTPGGLRGFDVSEVAREMGVKDYRHISESVGVDPYYIKNTMARNTYSSRLAPKPGRQGDYIARPLGMLKGDKSRINADSMREVSEFHDSPISNILKHKKKNGRIYLGGLFDSVEGF